MACGCSKNKAKSTPQKVTSHVRVNRPLNEGGRTRRAEKRIIR